VAPVCGELCCFKPCGCLVDPRHALRVRSIHISQLFVALSEVFISVDEVADDLILPVGLAVGGRVESFAKACLFLKLMLLEGFTCGLKLLLLAAVVLFQSESVSVCLFECWWFQRLHEHLGCHSFFLDELGDEVGAMGGELSEVFFRATGCYLPVNLDAEDAVIFCLGRVKVLAAQVDWLAGVSLVCLLIKMLFVIINAESRRILTILFDMSAGLVRHKVLLHGLTLKLRGKLLI